MAALVQGVLLGRLLKLASEQRLILTGIALLAAGFAWLPVTATQAALLGATAVIAVGHGLLAAPLNGLASQQASAVGQGRILGVMQSTASLARVAGPVLGGWLLQHDALQAVEVYGRTPYWAGAAILIAALAAAASGKL